MAERKNFFESVVDIFINEKNNTLNATNRDQRKNKNRDLEEAKYKYNAYLKRYFLYSICFPTKVHCVDLYLNLYLLRLL